MLVCDEIVDVCAVSGSFFALFVVGSSVLLVWAVYWLRLGLLLICVLFGVGLWCVAVC